MNNTTCRERKKMMKTVCRNYSFPFLFYFPYAHCIPLPLPCFPHSLLLSSFCTFHFFLHISRLSYLQTHTANLTASKTTRLPPISRSLPIFFLSLNLIPALPSLPDIVAQCPMSHTSAKIIRDGRRREQKKEIVREREKSMLG